MGEKHTPIKLGLPYGDVQVHIDAPPGDQRNRFIVIGDELNHVAYVPTLHPEAEANAEYLMLVWNTHDDLVAALEEIKRNCEPWKTADNMAGRLFKIADYATRKATTKRRITHR